MVDRKLTVRNNFVTFVSERHLAQSRRWYLTVGQFISQDYQYYSIDFQSDIALLLLKSLVLSHPYMGVANYRLSRMQLSLAAPLGKFIELKSLEIARNC